MGLARTQRCHMSKKPTTKIPVATATATVPFVMVSKNRASRPACNIVRAEIVAHATEAKVPVEADVLVPTGKPNDAKNPGLRYNLIEAVVASPTVGDALAQSVFGKPGSKHDTVAYKVRMVDVVFCITNGFVSVR